MYVCINFLHATVMSATKTRLYFSCCFSRILIIYGTYVGSLRTKQGTELTKTPVIIVREKGERPHFVTDIT